MQVPGSKNWILESIGTVCFLRFLLVRSPAIYLALIEAGMHRFDKRFLQKRRGILRNAKIEPGHQMKISALKYQYK
jgi:hypothetical protein